MEKTSNSIKKMKVKKIESEENLINTFYANGFALNVAENEFSVDFHQNPPVNTGKLPTTRIIIAPYSFKKFLEVFNKALKQYEKNYGEIKPKRKKQSKKAETTKK